MLIIPRMVGNLWLMCVSSKHLTHNYSLIFGMSYKMVPYLDIIPICTPRLLTSPLKCFSSIIQQKSMCLPRNHADVSFHQQWDWNQTSTLVAGTDGILQRDVMCYNCGRPGHYYGQCHLPDCHKTGTQSLHLSYYFDQTTPVCKNLINPNWILLNSCSTESSGMNPSLL